MPPRRNLGAGRQSSLQHWTWLGPEKGMKGLGQESKAETLPCLDLWSWGSTGWPEGSPEGLGASTAHTELTFFKRSCSLSK